MRSSLHWISHVSVCVCVATLIAFAMPVRAQAQGAPRFDLVVDIDWTLAALVPLEDQPGRRDLVRVGPEAYAVAEHSARVLRDLIATGDVRVHFFSGGSEVRNLELLSRISVSRGVSLLDLVRHSGGQVFSFHHLKEISKEGRFSDRYRKPIEALLPNVDPKRIILIDDVAKFEMGLMRIIPSFGIFNDRPTFDPSRTSEVYEAPNVQMWRAERSRWLVLERMIKQAIASDLRGDLSFRDSLLASSARLTIRFCEMTFVPVAP